MTLTREWYRNSSAPDLQRFGLAFSWFWFLNIILASAAFGLVVWNPWSAGSGIPETKCVLNGVSIPQVIHNMRSATFNDIEGENNGLLQEFHAILGSYIDTMGIQKHKVVKRL